MDVLEVPASLLYDPIRTGMLRASADYATSWHKERAVYFAAGVLPKAFGATKARAKLGSQSGGPSCTQWCYPKSRSAVSVGEAIEEVDHGTISFFQTCFQ